MEMVQSTLFERFGGIIMKVNTMDKEGFIQYIKEEFPRVLDTHWNWGAT